MRELFACKTLLQEQGQYTRIAIQAVMGYFSVGKKSNQREIPELLLNQF
jgi:hypothetical protein